MTPKATYEELQNRVAELEEQLHDREIRFKQIFENTGSYSYIVSPEGNILDVNRLALTTLGYSKNELIGSPVLKIYAHESQAKAKELFAKWKKTGKIRNAEMTVQTKAGDKRRVILNVDAVLDENGCIIHSISTQYDITRRKYLEQVHLESEIRFRTLVEFSPISIMMMRDGKYIYGNPASAELLGYKTSEEIIGVDVLKTIAPEYHETIRKRIKHLKAGEKNVSMELKIIRPNGETVWTKSRSLSVNLNGVETAVIFGQDITAQRKAELDLRESEERYRALVMQSTDCLILQDLEGNIIDVNPCACNTYGYTRQELLNMKVSDLDPDNVNHIEKDGLYEQMRPNVPTVFEGRQRSKDGREFPVNVHLSLMNIRGRTRVQGLYRDITERKEAEHQLRERETFLHTLIDAIPIPVFYKDKQGRYLGVNKAFESFFGATEESLLGRSVFDINPQEIAEDYHKKDQELLENGTVQKYESQGQDADGNLHNVVFNKAVFRDEKNRIQGIVGAILDITETKRAEKEKLEMQNRLQQAQKMESLGNLAGGISHDFNNILSPIVGLSEMLMEDLPKDSHEWEYVKEIYNAGLRGSDLVRQILAFSRQTEHRLIPVRIQSILKEVVKLSKSTIPSYVKIEEEIQSDCGLVMADPIQIHQIGMNMITNAYQALEQKEGRIVVGLRETILADSDPAGSNLEPGRYAVITISDNGIGMSEDIMDKIFDPYFTTKEKGKGTGLGLAVVYGIIKEYNGDIEIESELGKGTRFKIYLPLMEKFDHDLPDNSLTEYQTGNERVLLVDDEITIVKLQRGMLERLGYKVTSHTSSQEALAVFKADPRSFDLIITDMNMPSMTGAQLAKEILSIRPDMPIIICTGFSERINEEIAKQIGIKGYLLKPVIRSKLAAMIRKVLENTPQENK